MPVAKGGAVHVNKEQLLLWAGSCVLLCGTDAGFAAIVVTDEALPKGRGVGGETGYI